MKWLIIVAAISALAKARPETYKEQEDFQFSRSSSDEGSKSGYYGAQRGNMGGNYERAHNMDALAQHQMSGLVRQVEGDLGTGAKTKAGSVFSAANSRGIYGSGSFDSSNLQGRNFAEGVSYDSSNLRSSSIQSSSAQHSSSDYANRQSQSYGGYRRTAADAHTQTDDLQSLDNLQSSNQHRYGSSTHNSGYQSQAGFQEQRSYDSDRTNSHSGYGTNTYTRLTPVRIIVTPGGRVALPIATQTYDLTHGSSALNHNALDSEVALTSDNNQGSVYRPKYYETSYKYNKKWEKHDTIPVSAAIHTESPIPKNSELYEDVDVHTSGSQNARETGFQSAHSSSASGYNAAKSISSQSKYNTNYNSQQYQGGTSNSNSNAVAHTGYRTQLDHGFSSDTLNAYTQGQRKNGLRHSDISVDSDSNTQTRYNAGSQLDLNSQVEDLNTRPKSYHSSYSYHKSWERQGDPYVIKPASTSYSDTQTSQRLTSSTKNLGYTIPYQPSSEYKQRICEDNCLIRVARSYGTDNQYMEQQSESMHDDQGFNQQNQETDKHLEDLSQQLQKGSQIDGQQALNQWDSLKDISQQSPNDWGQQNVQQQSQNQWDNLKDFSQQSPNDWGQQNVQQQSQNQWDSLKDFSQQSPNDWGQQNVQQQSQNQWDNLKDLGQQSQSDWDQHNVQEQNKWDNLKDLSQQSHSNWDQQNVEQHSHNNWDKLNVLSQQQQNNLEQQYIAQEKTQNLEKNLENFSQQSQSDRDQINLEQQTQNQEDTLENLSQISQNNWDQQDVGQQSNADWDKIETMDQQTTSDKLEDISQNSQKMDTAQFFGQHAQNFLGQQNEDIEKEFNHKPQKDLNIYQSENNQKDTSLERSQSAKEKEHVKIDMLWDKFDNVNKDKLDFNQIQSNTDRNTEFKIPNQGMDKETTTSYTDVLSQKESHSFKDNFNIDIEPHQNESNDNSDYSYSSGFVNPFFNHYHEHQLSPYDSTYTENKGTFESNAWNSNVHSYSNIDYSLQKMNNSNVQDAPLTSLWSKFDQIERESGLSTHMNREDIFSTTGQTENNLTSLGVNDNNTLISQPWHIKDIHLTETSAVSENPEYKQSINNIIVPKNPQPETPRDIGRGDIGPEEMIEIDESSKPFKNPNSAESQKAFESPVKNDNDKSQILKNNNTYTEKEKLEDQLTVLSIQQQIEQHKIVTPNKNDATNNTLQTQSQYNKNIDNNEYNTKIKNLDIVPSNKDDVTFNTLPTNSQSSKIIDNNEYNVDLTNFKPRETVNIEASNPSHMLNKSHNHEQQIQTRADKQSIYKTRHQEQEFELQNGGNFEQENVNTEQENLYNFGQEDLQVFTQQNEKVDSHYLQKFQDPLQGFRDINENVVHQNLYNFGQEQILDVKPQNKTIEQHLSRQESTIDLKTEKRNLGDDVNEEVTQTNVNRVQKSIGSVDGKNFMNNNQDDLLHVQQKVEDLGQQTVYKPFDQFEQNYGTDYEPNSYEQNFDHDFQQHHQASSDNLNNFEQKSQIAANLQQQNTINNSPTTTTTSTQKTIISSQQTQKPETVTAKPGFWRSVGNKISSAKDKVVSWFKN